LPGYLRTIEDLREKDFPQLVGETYLDNAGCIPPANSILQAHFNSLSSTLFANPHSNGSPGSGNTQREVNHVRSLVLRHFNANPDEYTVVFTSNATASLELLSRAVPWQKLYVHHASHTSVLGIGPVIAERQNKPIKDAVSVLNDADVEQFSKRQLEDDPSLFAFPAQCNFSGTRYPLEWSKTVKATPSDVKVLVDAASYCSTSAIDLSEWPIDFLVLSFYKMFGFPTGLGA
jgi:molybdenum cofactor sulfurtransferase